MKQNILLKSRFISSQQLLIVLPLGSASSSANNKEQRNVVSQSEFFIFGCWSIRIRWGWFKRLHGADTRTAGVASHSVRQPGSQSVTLIVGNVVT